MLVFVSLTLVVLNTRKSDWFVAHANKNRQWETNMDTVTLFQSKTLTLNSCRSLDDARSNESIIYFTDLCKPIETYVYAKKKHPFTSYFAAEHSNATDIRKKNSGFF